jgi:ABC-type lipopolysaccharide export system ATPase subunit
MPLDRDNEAEREARIDKMVHDIQRVQKRVEQLAAGGRERAIEIARHRNTPDHATPESGPIPDPDPTRQR